MFDIDHLSVLTPEEYQEFLANLDKISDLDAGSYYAFIGEVYKKRNQ